VDIQAIPNNAEFCEVDHLFFPPKHEGFNQKDQPFSYKCGALPGRKPLFASTDIDFGKLASHTYRDGSEMRGAN
jgi:hypothetical protein